MRIFKSLIIVSTALIITACGGGGGGSSTATTPTGGGGSGGGGSGGGGSGGGGSDPATEETVALCDTQVECRAVLLTGDYPSNRHEIKNAAGEKKSPEQHLNDGASRLTVTRFKNYPDYTDANSREVDPRAWRYDTLFNYKGTEQTKSSTWHVQEKAVGIDKISERGKDVKIGIMDPGLFIKRNKDYASRLETGMGLYKDRFDNTANKWLYKWYTDYKPLWNTKYQDKMTGYKVDDGTDTHSDGMASVMAGTEYGIAKKAKIVPYTVVTLNRLNQGLQLKPVYDHMKANNVMAMGISIDLDNDPTLNKALYERELGKDFIDQVSDDADNNRDGPIWVFAASNDSKDNVGPLARAPKYIPKLKKYWIATVTTLGTTSFQYRFSKISNKCGDAKEWCMTAIGDGAKYKSSNIDGDTYTDEVTVGTSYAAPQITGGLAVLKSKFPSLTNVQLRERLLTTARHETADGKKLLDASGGDTIVIKDKDGNVVAADAEGGMSEEFGRGIMRLDLATQPVGSLTQLRLHSTKVDKNSRANQRSFVKGGQAFGDGLYNGFAQVNTKAFDRLFAPFDYNMSQMVASYTPPNQDIKYLSPVSSAGKNTPSSPPQKLAFSTTQQAQNPLGFSYTPSTVPFGADKGIMATYDIDTTTAFTAAVSPDAQDSKVLNTLNIQYAKTLQHIPGQQQKIFYGVRAEKGSIFGTKMGGQFALNGHTNTAYVLYKNTGQQRDWHWDFTGVMGVGKVSGLSGMLSGLNDLSVSEWNISAKRVMGNNKTLGVSIRQPIRIESGTANLVHVSQVNKGNSLSYTTTPTAITPSGREIQVETYYQHKNLTLKAYHKHNKGHSKGSTGQGVFAYYHIPFK